MFARLQQLARTFIDALQLDCSARFSAIELDPAVDILKSQLTATYCNILQHTAAHCNTLQHTVIHCNVFRLYSLIQM